MMGEHLLELDPEEEIVESFACFDDGDKGVVDVKEMRKHLGELGDRMEDWEVGLSFSPLHGPGAGFAVKVRQVG
jgi:myosin regulatory light chain 12